MLFKDSEHETAKEADDKMYVGLNFSVTLGS